ncbi:hypothetical protein G4D82_07975 [Flavobacterium sp. CYK-4]|uniref:hypothetical protein n=1 Tax=Flavobacterium lotistagni TaxID=2709660 RepID=UPI00140DD576|nr:hypothetical protein [Flavobacterium lotistagni]NHM07156.1 hypothetical protein [Flavobacterium lotistagni]
MKRSLFLYLFILSVLMNIFTYMYYSKKDTFDQAHFAATNAKLKDSLALVVNQVDDANYFSLEHNQNAQDYFVQVSAEKVVSYEDLIPRVKEKLMDFNENPEGNPYTGQAQLGAQKFIINKAKVLNHRWVIADYSDGNYWGEVLLKYFVNEDNSISFEVIQSVLYQK